MQQKLRYLAIVLLSALAGCSGPATFSRGQPIPIGNYTITVSYSEVSVEAGAMKVAVHFRCEGLRGREEVGKFFFTHGGHFFLVDANGNRYAALPLTLARYRSGASRLFGKPPDGLDPDISQWVAVGRVPNGSRGLKLIIENPDRKSGQPRGVIVALDR